MQYIIVDVARLSYETSTSAGWFDVNISPVWNLNVRRVLVPQMSRDGLERHREIRLGRALLPPNMLQDHTNAMNFPIWDTFGGGNEIRIAALPS
jgi:hypothetical protein